MLISVVQGCDGVLRMRSYRNPFDQRLRIARYPFAASFVYGLRRC